MLREVCASVCSNKNILMPVTVGIYILALFGTLSGYSILIAFCITTLLILAVLKNYLPLKTVMIWVFIFYFGIINTTMRLRDRDELLSLAPVNSTIYGKILSIPAESKTGKTKFFFEVNKIEYDGITRVFKQREKVFVSINTDAKFSIYDSYKIRGRLSTPVKAGNPSQFDYGNYLRNYSAYAVFYGRNPYSMRDLDIPCYEKLSVNCSKSEKILQAINSKRDKILQIHSKYIKSPNLEILGGIVFGDDAVSPPEDIKQSFVNSGLLHILAASGMNVAFIYSFFFVILRFFRVPVKLNIGICMLAVVTYVFMTGLGASVLRAALMLLFVLFGKLVDRDAHSIALLSFVAFLMLIYNPMYINDVGFQLSFLVTLGLLIMIPYIIQSENRLVNWLIGTVTIPVIAQLWVIPIQIFYFNNISIYSVFANIMSVPILSVISFGGFISSLLSLITPISDFICQTFDFILNPLIILLVKISDFWGSLPHSALQTTHPNPFQIIVYYLILVNIVYFADKEVREKYGKIMKRTLPVLICILFVSTVHISDKNLEITAFDVGNADAFMIKTPDKKYLMIDTAKSGYNGGKSQAEMLILKYFRDNGIKSLDSITVTHFDNDHCGGTVDLIKNMEVNNLYLNSLNHDSNAANEIYSAAKEHKVNIIKSDNRQIIYEKSGVKIENYILDNVKGVGDNESSIITLVTYGDFSMLFTGDAGIETLSKLKTQFPENISVFKVPHHGAAGVLNKSLADYLNPEYSIISTGENKFGHPSAYTLGILRNSKILRTDINNSVKVVVNKNGYRVLTYNPQKKKYVRI